MQNNRVGVSAPHRNAPNFAAIASIITFAILMRYPITPQLHARLV